MQRSRHLGGFNDNRHYWRNTRLSSACIKILRKTCVLWLLLTMWCWYDKEGKHSKEDRMCLFVDRHYILTNLIDNHFLFIIHIEPSSTENSPENSPTCYLLFKWCRYFCYSSNQSVSTVLMKMCFTVLVFCWDVLQGGGGVHEEKISLTLIIGTVCTRSTWKGNFRNFRFPHSTYHPPILYKTEYEWDLIGLWCVPNFPIIIVWAKNLL